MQPLASVIISMDTGNGITAKTTLLLRSHKKQTPQQPLINHGTSGTDWKNTG